MSFAHIQIGAVIRYSFLWQREHRKGETESRKLRQTVVGVRVAMPHGDVVILFPITSKQPEPGRFAIELPDIEKRRAKLDQHRPLWLILDEYNEDIVGRSYHLDPAPPIGYLSRAFLVPLLREFIGRQKTARRVPRHEGGD